MDSIYNSPKNTKTNQAFRASYFSNPNAFISSILSQAQNESKKLANETSIGSMYINALTKYVIGTGLTPSAAPENSILGWTDVQYKNFCQQAEAYFRLMSGRRLDYYNKFPFKKLQEIAFKNILIDGDVLLHRCYANKNMNYRPLVQIIAGHNIISPDQTDTKKIAGGVKMNNFLEEEGYYLKKVDENLMDTMECRYVNKYNKVTGFEEFDLVKLFVEEANQKRGKPYLTNIQSDILDIKSFTNAKVAKALVSALLTIAIVSEKDAPDPQVQFVDKIKDSAIQAAKDAREEMQEDEESFALGYGNILQLEPGQKAQTIESAIDGGDFKAFIDSMLDLLGGACSIPREMALGSFNSSFSAARGTIGTSEKGFAPLRQTFGDLFCSPVYEQVIDYGIRNGDIEAPGYFDSDIRRKAILGVTWIGPSPVIVNPTSEVSALKLALEANLLTHEQATRMLYGFDFDSVLERLKMENKNLKDIRTGEEDENR